MKVFYVSSQEDVLYVCKNAETAEFYKMNELEENDNDCEIEEVIVSVRATFADTPVSESFIYWVIPEFVEYPEESSIEFASLSEEDAESKAKELSISDDCAYKVFRVEVLSH